MRKTRLFHLSLLALSAWLTLGATAQEIRLGGLEGNNAAFASQEGTFIDWSRPADATGSVATASVAWADASTPCDGIFYVRFFVIPSNAFAVVMTAERGPFRAVTGINTVALEPPVPVTPETYVGIRRGAGPSTCGQPYGTFTREPARTLFSGDDYKGGAFTSLSPLSRFRLQVQASSTPSVRVATIPVVASAQGAFGSFFRTALTLSNQNERHEIRGKLIFHPAGRSGSNNDPSLDFVIPKNGTLNYEDIVATMGQAGSQGSLDILTTASPTPLATARVFNDAGAAGTSGLVQEAVPAGRPYQSVAAVLIPTDLTNYRLNVGLRTFDAATLSVIVYDANGTAVAHLSRNVEANFFSQVSAATFTDGALPPGGKIVVSAFEKEFIFYGAVTDNRTNDPSMRIGLD